MPRKTPAYSSKDKLLDYLSIIDLEVGRFLTNSEAGIFSSRRSGEGIDFLEYRDYQIGDDPIKVDQSVKMRLRKSVIALRASDNALPILIAVDGSSPMFFGSQKVIKRDFALQCAAIIGLSALRTANNVSLIYFNEDEDYYFSPVSKKSVFVSELLDCAERVYGVSAADPFDKMDEAVRTWLSRTGIVSQLIIISDFYYREPRDLEKFNALLATCFMHDVLAVVIEDPLEREFPQGENVAVTGFLSGGILDMSSPETRKSFSAATEKRRGLLKEVFSEHGIASAEIVSSDDEPGIALGKLYLEKKNVSPS